MPRITNPRYLEFNKADTFFKPITEEEFITKLNSINYSDKYKTMESRAYCIIAYYSGLRPAEILDLKPENIDKSGRYVDLILQAKKGGAKHPISIPKNDLTIEFFDYAKSKTVPGQYVFRRLRSERPHIVKWKQTIKDPKDDSVFVKDRKKLYFRTTNKVQYMVLKYFGFPPYYFRHNRFTSMLQHGATLAEIKHQKLGKTLACVEPYLKHDIREARKTARTIKKD
jgi:integrase